MKKLLFSIGFLTACQLVSFAQNGAITNAKLYLDDKEYDKAKSEIDKAVVHEKTMNSAKAWARRGDVYDAIAFNVDKNVKALCDSAIDVAYSSYLKAISLDNPNGSIAKSVNSKLEYYWSAYINEGLIAYKFKNYDKSLSNYNKSMYIKPNDTTAYIYASYAAYAKGDYESLNALASKLMNLNYSSVAMYANLIFYNREVKKDLEKALDFVKIGRAKYPNEVALISEEFNTYLATGNKDLAKQSLQEAITKNPNNSLLYYNLGVLTEQIGPKEDAVGHYIKAIEIDSANTDAKFNLGAFYYNQAVEIFKDLNQLSVKDYNTKGKTMEDNAKGLLNQGLPYLESVYRVKPDMQLKKILIDSYTKLKMFDKREALMK